MLDKRKPALAPEDVVALLKLADAAELQGPQWSVHVPHETLRELLTVWLRLAALHEQVEQNPTDFDPEMRCAIEVLFMGGCYHLAAHDTEPANEKPEQPIMKCPCGYHGPVPDDYGFDNCPGCGAEPVLQ